MTATPETIDIQDHLNNAMSDTGDFKGLAELLKLLAMVGQETDEDGQSPLDPWTWPTVYAPIFHYLADATDALTERATGHMQAAYDAAMQNDASNRAAAE